MKKYCHDPRHMVPCLLPCAACEIECRPPKMYRIVFRVKGGGYRYGAKDYTYREAVKVLERSRNGKRIEVT